MGVHGLWQIIQSTGRPITLESLADQVLAVDVSLWLHQTVKGMRDRDGNPVPNAHLAGLFHRVCKLLYYRVKPVFVFDGGVPILKRQTMAMRKKRQEAASESASNSAQKLLTNLLQQNAVSAVLGSPQKRANSSQNEAGPSSSQPLSLSPKKKATQRDMFELQPLPEEPGSSEEIYTDESQETWLCDQLDDIDPESSDFMNLPAEYRHEMLVALKEDGKRSSWNKIETLPKNAMDFSSYQLQKLMKQSKLAQKIKGVQKELVSDASQEILGWGDMGKGTVECQKVASEDSAHYILIHGLEKDVGKNKTETNQASSQEASKSYAVSKIDRTKKRKVRIGKKGCMAGIREEEDICLSSETDEEAGEKTGKDSNDTKEELASDQMEIVELFGNYLESDDLGGSLVDTLELQGTSGKKELPLKAKHMEESSENEAEELGQSLEDTGQLRENSEKEDLTRSPIETEGLFKRRTELIEELKVRLRKMEDIEVSEKKRELSSSPEISEDETKTEEDSSMTITEKQSVARDIKPDVDEEESSADDDFIEVSTTTPVEAPADDIFQASDFTPAPVTSTDLTQISDNEEDEVIEEVEDEVKEEVMNEVKEEVKEEQTKPETSLPHLVPSLSQGELLEQQQALEQERSRQERMALSITDQMRLEAQEMLRLFGLPYVDSPMEAEAQCARLEALGLTEGTITDDSDVWLFGASKVYKNLFNQRRQVEMYSADDLRSHLLLDQEQLISVALLCGSDYTCGVEGVGPVTAMEILAEFPGTGINKLEQFKEWWEKAQNKPKVKSETKVKTVLRRLKLHEGFPSAAVFEAYLHPTVDSSEDEFSWGRPDLDLLRSYVCEKLGWTQDKVDDSLLPVMKQLNAHQVQPKITSYFTTEMSEAGGKIKSKRMKRVINVMRREAPLDKTHPSRSATSGKKRRVSAKNSGGFLTVEKHEVELSEKSSSDDEKYKLEEEKPVSKEEKLQVKKAKRQVKEEKHQVKEEKRQIKKEKHQFEEEKRQIKEEKAQIEEDFDEFDLYDDISDAVLGDIDLSAVETKSKVTDSKLKTRGLKFGLSSDEVPNPEMVKLRGKHKGSLITLSLDKNSKRRKNVKRKQAPKKVVLSESDESD